jgi:hypothetical protein
VTIAVTLFPMAAEACLSAAPARLLSAVRNASDQVIGVYQLRTVAQAARIPGLHDFVTASVVTRYWGEPPDQPDIYTEGGAWFRFSDLLAMCGWGPPTTTGNVRFGMVKAGAKSNVGSGGSQIDLGEGHGYWPSGKGDSLLSRAERRELRAAFGPPKVVGAPKPIVLLAVAMTWVGNWIVFSVWNAAVLLMTVGLLRLRQPVPVENPDRQSDVEPVVHDGVEYL